MEFGRVGFDGVVSSSNGLASFTSDQAEKHNWAGSTGFLKDNGGSRASKIAKLGDDLSASKPSSFDFSDVGKQEDNMLSFSSSKLEHFSPKNNGGLMFESKIWQSPTFPSYLRHRNVCYCKSSCTNGYPCSGGSMNANMYVLNGVKGPFTPSQWLELEQQAMIYKYIIANEPIPPNLLIPITRAFESTGFSSYPGGFLRPNSFGCGTFHLGFSNSIDPEPGRCRRTDGKKWRCSRDAVPDQKYCERHMNRGRHRSRKPVEGQVGHSISRATTSKTTPTTNLTNAASSSSLSTLVVPGLCSSNNFAITLSQNKDLHPVTRHDFLSPSISLNSSGSTFSIDKEQIPYEESVDADGFAGLSSDSLIQRNPSLYRTTYSSSSHDVNALESDPQNPDRSSILWPKLQIQSDYRTQLSISIPAALPADFMSSTSSPTGERVTALSPLRLSRALDTVEMGLGVGIMEQSKKQASWVPVSWETSLGGPLGEVLKTTSNSSEDPNKNHTSALNLLYNGWEGSPQVVSSPNDVLQRTTLHSLSTSSAGSSPRAENGKFLESGGFNVNLVGSTLGNSCAFK